MVHDKYKVPYNEIAVLYRMTYLSRNIEERLMKEKIPYTLIGGTPFFCRAEVQDILSYLKIILNDKDVMAFKRSVAVPKRGVGEKSIIAIDEFARNFPVEPLSIREALVHKDLKLKGKAKTTIKEYAEFLDRLEEKYLSDEPAEVIKWLITELNYMDYLEATYKDAAEVQVRAENLFELVNVASEYESIEDLIVQASLYREDKEEDEDKVQLLTMHKSKGLEYKCVIVVGASETVCPHFKALDDPAQIEEERRLMYVAMTRAKDYLFMTYPTTIKAQGREQYVAPSRFLNEIDRQYVHKN
jgi:DNA helicase-2/ATP-dependent DNA helicase PcrA